VAIQRSYGKIKSNNFSDQNRISRKNKHACRIGEDFDHIFFYPKEENFDQIALDSNFVINFKYRQNNIFQDTQ